MSDAMAIAASALAAQSINLDTAAENLANVNTPGYAQERANLSPMGSPGAHGAGSGVRVTDISRITDQLLTGADRTAHATLSATTAQQNILGNIQNVFSEPSSNGLAAQLTTFYSDWNAVANYPTNAASRQAVVTQAQTIANTLNTSAASLQATASQTLNQLQSAVTQDNGLLKQVANLNQQILAASTAGSSTVVLQDQRDAVLNQLSSDLGVTVHDQSDGMVNVTLGGVSLVTGATPGQMAQPVGSGTPATYSLTDSYGNPLNSVSGTVGGLLTGLNTIVPKYLGMLDNVAQNLANTVNSLQQQGYDQSGNAGQALFVGNLGSGGTTTTATAITAGNITVNPSMTAAGLAAATTQTAGGNSDGTNAQRMAQISTATTSVLQSWGVPALGGSGPVTADNSYQTLVGDIGTANQLVQSQFAAQTAAAQAQDASVQSVSGVNQDQEMTNIVSYQQAYEAAAKVISTVNATIQALLAAT